MKLIGDFLGWSAIGLVFMSTGVLFFLVFIIIASFTLLFDRKKHTLASKQTQIEIIDAADLKLNF